MQHLDAVGILLQIVHGVLAAHGRPIYIHLEEYALGIGVLHHILPNDLSLHLLILVRVVVVTQQQAVLLCQLAHLVEVVAHALQLLQVAAKTVTRDHAILGAHDVQRLEELAPLVHRPLLVIGIKTD